MKKRVANFSINYLQILDHNGKFDSKLAPKISNKKLIEIYEQMVYARIFDAKQFSLQRQGLVGTVPQSKGQEACQVPVAHILNSTDWVVPSFREWPVLYARGVSPLKLLQVSGGDERGNVYEGNNLPNSIPVASQLTHACGIAYGIKYNKKKDVVVVYFSDGATSEGDFHEAMNFASVFDLPVIFICQNNQYAISLNVANQTKSKTIAQKAIAYEMNSIKVDGNDVFSVYSAVQEATKNARAGNGPTLIEALTYRLADHTTSDDSLKYRDKKELKQWLAKDPNIRLYNYLVKKKLWSEKKQKELVSKIEKDIESVVSKYKKLSAPKIDEMFKYKFEKMTPELKLQLEEAKNAN